MNLTNQFLIAMPGMGDENFAGSVIYVCEHNADGALGLVINKPTDIRLANLFEKVDLPLARPDLVELPVYYGGPVQTERGFVLHDQEARTGEDGKLRPGYASSLTVPDGLEMTTSRDVLEAISSGDGPRRILVTLGYAGWSAGQLESELANNGWLTVSADAAVIFDTPAEQRYNRALGLLGVTPAALVGWAGHA